MHKFLFALCGALFACVLSAAQVNDLYQGMAPTSGDMTAAQSQALSEVLVKVSGKRDILAQPDVVKALAAPKEYVQQYGYQDEGQVKILKAQFVPAKVNALIAGSKYALLGPARPQLAFWLVQDDGERRIISDQSGDGWSPVLRSQAQTLGLPVSIPLMDLDDSMAVSATDVWGRFAGPILKASQRYGAEMVVLGQLVAQGEGWALNWALYGPKSGATEQLTKGEVQGSQQEIATGLADALAGWLVENYGARLGGVSSSQALQIEGVQGIDDMISLQKLLQGMASVTQVTIGQLNGDKVNFSLTLQGDRAELIRGLELEPRLQRLPDEGNLRYQWSQP